MTATADIPPTKPDQPIVEVQNLKMYFPVTQGIMFQRVVGQVKAVDDVSFDIARGETMGLVGESGCGKTTTGRCILQLTRPTSGRIMFNGQDITRMDQRSLVDIRKQIQVIFQDPYSSLNPRMTIGHIIGEGPRVHGITKSKAETQERVEELLALAGLPTNLQGLAACDYTGTWGTFIRVPVI